MKFNKIFSIIISLILILSTFSGCRKINGGMSSGNASGFSSNVYGIVDVLEDNESDLESVISDIDSNDAQSTDSNTGSSYSNSSSNGTSSTSTGSTDSSIFTENVVSVGDGGNPDNNDDDDGPLTFIEPDPEIPQDKGPFATAPDKDGNVITVDIKAGNSVYYKISRVSNKILTINNPNAYVIYNDTKYEANGEGVVSFLVETDLMMSERILFEIGNKGSKTESFTINFASPSGTWDNKKVITDIGKEISVTLDAGDEDGYWYKFVPTKSSTFKFYLLSGTDTGILMVTNNRNSAQRSSEIEDELKSDSTGVYLELQVEKGDKIVINVGARKSDTKTTLTIMIK